MQQLWKTEETFAVTAGVPQGPVVGQSCDAYNAVLELHAIAEGSQMIADDLALVVTAWMEGDLKRTNQALLKTTAWSWLRRRARPSSSRKKCANTA